MHIPLYQQETRLPQSTSEALPASTAPQPLFALTGACADTPEPQRTCMFRSAICSFTLETPLSQAFHCNGTSATCLFAKTSSLTSKVYYKSGSGIEVWNSAGRGIRDFSWKTVSHQFYLTSEQLLFSLNSSSLAFKTFMSLKMEEAQSACGCCCFIDK